MQRGAPSLFLTAAVLIFYAATGCGPAAGPPPASSPTQAGQDMLRILREENGLTVISRELGRTVWIYLPMEEGFLQLKAGRDGAHASEEAQVKPALNFLDGSFDGGQFLIKYDIGPLKAYPKSFGYDSAFSEQYRQNQSNILTAIYRAFGHFQEPASGGGAADGAPDFFVIVIADITNGLEARVTLHLGDLLRAYSDSGFYEEYARRIISDQPVGGQDIIGDRAGRHVAFKDLSWGEFLAKQMVHRITFKYQQSAFPPADDARREILAAAADTAAAYGFKDFQSVVLRDLGAGTDFEVSPSDLAGYASDSSPSSQGRLIHIKFQ